MTGQDGAVDSRSHRPEGNSNAGSHRPERNKGSKGRVNVDARYASSGVGVWMCGVGEINYLIIFSVPIAALQWPETPLSCFETRELAHLDDEDKLYCIFFFSCNDSKPTGSHTCKTSMYEKKKK